MSLLFALTTSVTLSSGFATSARFGNILTKKRQVEHTGTAKAPTLPNVQYTGKGYDLLFGNPQATEPGGDPGFRQQIFELNYGELTTGDQRWSLPDGYDAVQTRSCSLQAQTTEIFGETSYSQSLKTAVKFGGNLDFGADFKASFSGSSDYKRVSKQSSQSHMVAFEAKAVCTEYTVQIQTFNLPPLNRNFKNAVVKLIEDPTSARNLIAGFGTHVVIETLMGARAIVQTIFNEDVYKALRDESFSWTRGATASFALASGDYSTTTNEDRQIAEKFRSKKSGEFWTFIGKLPPADGNVKAWAATVADAPFPYRYTLMHIAELVSPENFPDQIKEKVIVAQKALSEAVSRYCESGGRCDGPAPDYVPPRPSIIPTTHTMNQGSQLIQFGCPAGSALSAGMTARDTAARSHYASPAYLVQDGGAKCRAGNPADCSLLCTSYFSQIRTIYAPEQGYSRGAVEARCPAGFVVAGCGYNSDDSKPEERWPQSYPDSPTTCRCYNFYGAQCEAICVPAAEAPRHQIISRYGQYVRVGCPNELRILGCGIKQEGSGNHWEKFWYVGPLNVNECVCYNWFGATCFAVCA